MPKHITKEEKDDIINFYKAHPMTIDDVAQHFNISNPSIIKILNEYKTKRYSKVQLFSPNLIENYFENIDTEEKAYFLGLIVTDGCVHNTKGKQNLISLTLQEKDEYLLEEFKRQIKSNKTITHDGRGCSELNILSNKMVNDLRKYDIIPNKSLRTVFPKNLPVNLYPHFIRGVLDGDGSISYYGRNKQGRNSHTKAIRFCQGNELFLQDIVNHLNKECGIEEIKVYKEKENLWSISYRKNVSMIKLIHYMYDNAHVYMTRKKDLCDLIIKEILQYGSTEITIESNDSIAS